MHAVRDYNYFMSSYRMTWLKKRLKELGLQRRGPLVHYSPLPRVQAAIEVCYITVHVCYQSKRLRTEEFTGEKCRVYLDYQRTIFLLLVSLFSYSLIINYRKSYRDATASLATENSPEQIVLL